MNIQSILDKFGAIPNSYYPHTNNPKLDAEKEIDRICGNYKYGYPPPEELMDPTYLYLKNKWSKYVDSNFFGFNLPLAPKSWYLILDEFFSEVQKECPQFKILRVYLKYGVLKVDLSGINDDIKQAILDLENTLWDEKLV